jgi:hypothetical protein
LGSNWTRWRKFGKERNRDSRSRTKNKMVTFRRIINKVNGYKFDILKSY